MYKKINEQTVAIIYDHLLTSYGGAELVLQILHTTFPNAPIYTTLYNPEKTHWTKGIKIIPTFLQKFYFFLQKRELLDLFAPLALEQHDLSRFDIVISVTSSAAKGVLTIPRQLHICYLLTPTRYLYQDRVNLSKEHSFLSMPLIKQLKDSVLNYLTWWDQIAATRPDKIIAISKVVAQRTDAYYHRTVDAILYPPVEINTHRNTVLGQNLPTSFSFFLCFSRLVSYKRIDKAIAACVQTKQMLVIGGTGRDEKKLQTLYPKSTYVRAPQESIEHSIQKARLQQKNCIFLGVCNENEKQFLFQNCTAVLMPGIEDFGITALEANAYGKPVILAKESGAAEVITDNIHGLHLKNQSTAELITQLKKITQLTFSTAELQTNALQFSRKNFIRKLRNIVYQFSNEHSTIIG